MRDVVLRWLGELPAGNQVEPFSYEEWQQRGRAIPNVTSALVELITDETIGESSGRAGDAIYAVGMVGDASSAGALEQVLDGANDRLRAEAAWALGTLGVVGSLTRLRTIALDPAEEINVRANACMALGRLNEPESRAALEAVLRVKPLPTAVDPLRRDSETRFLADCVKAALALLTR